MTAPLPPDLEETNVLGEPGPPDPEPPPSRRLGWGMLVGLLVLLAVAGAAAAAWFAAGGGDDRAAAPETTAAGTQPATTALLPPNQVFVPDVTGLQEREAATRLGAAGLEPRVKHQATAKPTGTVVSQKPKAAKRAKKGSQVTIVVDAGRAARAVPDVTGLDVAAAGARLKDAGFSAQTTRVTSDAKAGTVLAQAPAAGKKAKQGSVVTLSVARQAPGTATATTAPKTTTAAAPTPPPPPAQATVPDLSGGDLQAASHALSGAGLLATVQYVPADEPLGTVVEQAPSAGESAKTRSHVTVNVSTGPGDKPQLSVPDTTGQTLDQAVATLNAAGLRLIFVKVPVTTRGAVGTVVEQTPTAGAQAPRNAQVLVYLGVSR